LTTASPKTSADAAGATHGLPDLIRDGYEWLPIGVVMAAGGGTIVLVNRAFERLIGYDASELIGQPIEMLVPEVTRTVHAALRDGYMQHPEPRAMGAAREFFACRKDGTEVPVEVGLTPVVFGDRRFVLAAVIDITERRRSQAELRRTLDDRIEFESLVVELAAQFVNLPAGDVDRSIEEALGRLARALSLDRSALFQHVEATGEFMHTHQWTRPGCASPPLRISANEQFPWLLSQIREGDLVSFTSVDEVPDPIDREGLRRLGTRSCVIVPLVIRGRTWGAVTFATIGEPRTWAADIINRLRVVALIFANVLARKQGDEALRRATAENASLRTRLRDENTYLRHEMNALVGVPAIVGNSPGIRRVLEQVRQVADSDASVLLVGETGTGKSVLAHRIHDMGPRRERALVRVNCVSLPAASVESNLFGQHKGAYVVGEARRVGLLELANGSTVFLDEVADLPTDTQASLARVLQSREIQPLGRSHPMKVDLRVIAATRRDLAACIEAGTFRDDLYYRLNVLPLHIPPLRERTEDIPLLVWRFVDEFSQTYGKTIDTIDQESMALLQQYRWPGNARELRNVVERAMIVATGRRLKIVLPTTGAGSRGSETLLAVEKAHISATLVLCGGKIRGKGGAADRLGLSPPALEAKLKKLGLRRRADQAH
jgi:formate hydrogenlyase transcriptional activator